MVSKMVGQPWASTVSHKMQKLHAAMVEVTALPQQGQLALDEFTRAGGRGLSFPLETMPRFSPRHDGNLVSVFCLQVFLRANKSLPLAATRNVAQGALRTLSGLLKVRQR